MNFKSIALIVVLLLNFSSSAFADLIYHKSGAVFEGSVVEEFDDKYVVEMPEGTVEFDKSEILDVKITDGEWKNSPKSKENQKTSSKESYKWISRKGIEELKNHRSWMPRIERYFERNFYIKWKGFKLIGLAVLAYFVFCFSFGIFGCAYIGLYSMVTRQVLSFSYMYSYSVRWGAISVFSYVILGFIMPFIINKVILIPSDYIYLSNQFLLHILPNLVIFWTLYQSARYLLNLGFFNSLFLSIYCLTIAIFTKNMYLNYFA